MFCIQNLRSNLCKIRLMLIIIILFLVCSYGCAQKTPFIYEHPKILDQAKGTLVIAFLPIDDRRTDSDELDACFERDPIDSLHEVIRNELISTGKFADVVFVDGEEALDRQVMDKKAELLMRLTMNEMKWEVPGYEEMVQSHNAGAFVAGFAGGLIGGAIYMAYLAKSEVEVYGDATIVISITLLAGGNVLLEKEYTSHCVEHYSKLECGEPETKSEMVGKAIKQIMKEFKSDLVQAINATERTAGGVNPQSRAVMGQL